ncbi:MAG TPA: hypothetical protein VF085_02250 [Solirubrobacterales bacterium]
MATSPFSQERGRSVRPRRPAALVSAAIPAGELPPHDPETTALVLLGALIEAAMPIVVAEDRAAARERSEAAIVDLLEGIGR